MAKKIPKRFTPLITALHLIICRLPLSQAAALMAYVLTKGSTIFVKPENMRVNIREAFPEMETADVNALANTMLGNFGRHIAEIAHISDFRDGKNGARLDCTTPDGRPFDGKGPAIYVGGHIGSWELSPLIFEQQGQPVTVIYSQNKNAIIENLLQTQRRQTRANYVEKFKALRPCYHALDRGESVAMLVDQRVNPGIDVEFFGRIAAMSRLPARLATGFDCPIIPFEVVRVAPGHLRVVFQEPILPNGQKGKQVELQLTQKVADAVQASITRNVDTWFCSKLRWKRVDRERNRLREQQAAQRAAQSSDKEA